MDKEVYCITSHNSRIQCLLNEIVNKSEDSPKIRLKNCAIVRIEFFDTISVKMLYSGELADSEAHKISKYPYSVAVNDLLATKTKVNTEDLPLSSALKSNADPYMSQSGSGLKSFLFGKPKTENVSMEQALDFVITNDAEVNAILVRLKLQKINDDRLRRIKRTQLITQMQNPGLPQEEMVRLGQEVKMLNPGKPVIFYIIRHGQALHNETKFMPQTDTELRETGRQQAKLAGHAFLKILEEYNEIPQLLFVSDLKRTHQTLKHIIVNALLKAKDRQPEQSPLYSTLLALNKQPFVILPCASEISQVAHDGKCDQKNADARFYKKLALENYSRCSVSSLKSDPSCMKEDDHTLIWDYYLYFYGNAVRSERFETITRYMNDGNRKKCRDTNMIANVFGFLMYIQSNNERGPSLPRMEDPYKTASNGGTRKKRKTRRKVKKSLRF